MNTTVRLPVAMLSILLAIGVFFGTHTYVQAQLAVPGWGFGGVTVAPVPCLLNPGASLVAVAGVRGGALLYDPKINKPFAYGPPVIPKRYVLGRLGPVLVPCQPGPPLPLMLFQGTSGV